MKIQIVMVGKSSVLWKDIERHYIKRLKPYVQMDYSIVPEEKGRDCDASRVIASEHDRLIQKTSKQNALVLCDERGANFSSKGFSEFIRSCRDDRCVKGMSFVIGGSWGLDASRWPSPDRVLSFSKMTLPHQMARVFLLEQIYRSFLILSGHKYHKE